MKLSIIIPAYNEEQYIGMCLDSVFKEVDRIGDASIEVIVVNNASTDKTREIAASYARVIIVDEKKKGLVYARQAGVVASSGELLAHIDSDVIVPRGWIDTVFNEFNANPRLVALSGPYLYYDVSNSVRFGIKMYYYVAYAAYWVNRFILRVGSLIQGGNFVVKRSAWQQIGKSNEAFVFWGEDADLARRLHSVGDVKFMLRFAMSTSGRRLIHEGFLVTGSQYVLNYLSVIFFKKPFSKKYNDIRTVQEINGKGDKKSV